ncbi:MAG: DUF3160 domain-containing protein [Actinobacteria bacterium]|nr:DUF3160 domain-containing protein [Actinomycetota bacterium]
MKKLLSFIMIVTVISTASAQEMIANITQPVQTDFGVYTPHAVTITPNIKPCEPGDSLENVVNLDQFNFSDTQLALLKKNHFVVTPARRNDEIAQATGYNEMFDIYNEARENHTPIFITSDAMLHTFHLCFDYILKTCEEKRFIGNLNALLNALLAETQQQYDNSTQDVIRAALISNLNYLIVAKQLLDSTYVPPLSSGKFTEELALVRAAQGFHLSPIFGYTEDYSQYIPRGHYTRSDSLKSYFRSMMWLGRMTFSCETPDDSFSRDATLRAVLLIHAMSNTLVNDKPGLKVWDDIYQPTVFFVGKSDDINFYQYISIAENVYGEDFDLLPVDDFANEDKLTAFLQETKDLPFAAIDYPGQPKKGFRFMGQRFIPDSWVLDELVELKTPGRFIPTGLDVMIVLGSDQARTHLKPEDLNNSFYLENLAKLVETFKNYPDETWAQNAYWNWLYSLLPLLAVKGQGYPFFMQTSAWADKDLYAVLASWAELRHDTILYAKQSGTEVIGTPPAAIESQGFVEPNPHFYGRLASLSEFMITGLGSRNLLFENFRDALEKIATLSLQLKEISEKELTNISLSSNDYKTIFDIGKTLYDIVTFNPWPGSGPMPEQYNDDLEPMPVIADVHTDANSGLVLEEGIGYPYAIYAICNVEGRAVITKGAGFSYHEFTWPMDDRLTDEKWRQMLTDGTAPDKPSWSNSFFAAQDDTAKFNPDFYQWGKPESITFDVQISPEKIIVGDTVRIEITNYAFYDAKPNVSVLFGNEERLLISDINGGTGGHVWVATIPTLGKSQGKVYVDISQSTGLESISYRASFDLHEGTKVTTERSNSPSKFRLYQNWPNPFNPVTAIGFELPTSEHVCLEIFNINGRFIKEIVNSSLSAGSYTFFWNGKNELGRQMSSGIYYCRLQAGKYVNVKRMVLLR